MLGTLGINKSEHSEQEITGSLLNIRKITTKFQRIWKTILMSKDELK